MSSKDDFTALAGLADDMRNYTQRKTMERKDPWLPESQLDVFSEYARGLIELVGNERANELMSEAVITALGNKAMRELQRKWIGDTISWIDLCAQALRDAGKETP